MSNLIPLYVRSYIQKIALSAPIGVGVYVIGDTPLSMHLGESPSHISLWITGADILTEKKHYSWEVDEPTFSEHLELFGHAFDYYQDEDYACANSKMLTYHTTSIRDRNLELFFIKEQMPLAAVLKCLPMDILRCYIDDTASLEWEVKIVNDALKNKTVQVYGEDNALFYYHNYEYERMGLVQDYKKRFPDLKFWMEL